MGHIATYQQDVSHELLTIGDALVSLKSTIVKRSIMMLYFVMMCTVVLN